MMMINCVDARTHFLLKVKRDNKKLPWTTCDTLGFFLLLSISFFFLRIDFVRPSIVLRWIHISPVMAGAQQLCYVAWVSSANFYSFRFFLFCFFSQLNWRWLRASSSLMVPNFPANEQKKRETHRRHIILTERNISFFVCGRPIDGLIRNNFLFSFFFDRRGSETVCVS